MRSRRSRKSAASGCRKSRRPGSPTTRASAEPAAAGAAALADVEAAEAAGVRPVRRRHRLRRPLSAVRKTRSPAAPRARSARIPARISILRNLATRQEITIPEVTEYDFDKKGAWLVYRSRPGGREGRRVRAPDERRLRQDASLRTRPLQEPHVRRRRAAARVPERQGGVRQAGVARTACITGRRATPPRSSSLRPATARHAAAAWS